MIQLKMVGCKWGIAPSPGGAQLIMLSGKSFEDLNAIVIEAPFEGDALGDLIVALVGAAEAASVLKKGHRAKITETMAQGIILPRDGQVPDDIRGPQG